MDLDKLEILQLKQKYGRADWLTDLRFWRNANAL